MNFPTIFDLLERLAFLRGDPAVVVVLLAGAVAIVAWGLGPVRRPNAAAPLAVPAMLVVYLVGGILLVDVLDARLAVVYVMAGVIIALILLITGLQTRWGQPPAGLSAGELARLNRLPVREAGPLAFSTRSLLRLGLAVVILLGVFWLARMPGPVLPFVPEGMAHLETAVLGLAGLGLVGVVASPEPMPAASGLLLFLFSFALAYGMVDPSMTMVVALIGLQLTVALAASYLAQARHLPVDVLE